MKQWPTKIKKFAFGGFFISVAPLAFGQNNFSDNVLSYLREAQRLEESLRDAKGDLSASDRRYLQNYFARLKEFYLTAPLQVSLSKSQTGLNSAKQKIEEFQAEIQKLNDNPSGFRTCVLDQGLLANIKSSEIEEAQGTLSKIEGLFSGSGESLNYNDARNSLSIVDELSQITPTKVSERIKTCCNKPAATGAAPATGSQNDCSKFSPEASPANLFKNISGNLDFARALPPLNPLEESQMKPAAIVGLLRDETIAGSLRAARVSGDLAGSRNREQEIFSQIEDGCKKGQKEAQEDSKPLDLRPWTPFFKAVKCHLLPTIATLYADTTTQKITLGVGAAQIQGDNWDVNCSPEEIALYDRMRPTDPNVVAQQWGIPQMANPAYIQNLRMLPPVTGPFPITPVPGGGYVTPYGTIAIPEDLTNVSSVPSTGEAGGRRKNFSGDRRGGGARTSSGGSRGLGGQSAGSRPPVSESLRSLAARSRSGRGVANGQGLTVGTRSLGARIARGQGVPESINTLRSGAGQTRALAQNIATNVRSLGSGNLRTSRKNLANQSQNHVRALGGARASRTTSQGILDSLRQSGRSGPTTSPTTPVVGSIGDVKQQNEQARRRMEKQVRMYLEDMQLITKRAEEVRKKIFDLVGNRDVEITNVMSSLPDKNPRKQSRAVQDLRMRLNEIDKQISTLKAEYDVYQASMFERGELVRNLAAFGTSSPNFPGYGGQNDPNKLREGFPKPSKGSGNSGGGRGQSAQNSIFNFADKLWALAGVDKLNLFTKAWAAPGNAITSGLGQYASELEWGQAFNKYLVDLEKWVGIRTKDENTAHKEIFDFMQKREKEVTLTTARDDDVETLVTMEIYSEALSTEAKALISAAIDGKLPLRPDQISSLRQIDMDAQRSLEALERVNIDYAKSYPLSYEDNSEAWMPLLTGALLY